MTLEEPAKYILYDCGLLEELNGYRTPHVIRSYRMGMMTWNGFDIEDENISSDRLYRWIPINC